MSERLQAIELSPASCFRQEEGHRTGDYLVASVDLPIVGAVIEASAKAPYLCLQIDFVVAVLSELAIAHPHPGPAAQPQRGLMINDATDALPGACGVDREDALGGLSLV